MQSCNETYSRVYQLHSHSNIYNIIFFFFSSRRRHTRFDCDWSSDVCSSDLISAEQSHAVRRNSRCSARCLGPAGHRVPPERDRKSVVLGKSVDLGGRRIIKKKIISLLWSVVVYIRRE